MIPLACATDTCLGTSPFKGLLLLPADAAAPFPLPLAVPFEYGFSPSRWARYGLDTSESAAILDFLLGGWAMMIPPGTQNVSAVNLYEGDDRGICIRSNRKVQLDREALNMSGFDRTKIFDSAPYT